MSREGFFNKEDKQGRLNANEMINTGLYTLNLDINNHVDNDDDNNADYDLDFRISVFERSFTREQVKFNIARLARV